MLVVEVGSPLHIFHPNDRVLRVASISSPSLISFSVNPDCSDIVYELVEITEKSGSKEFGERLKNRCNY